MVVQSLPPGQFTVTNTVAVLNKLELIQEGAVARYGPGGFRWLSTVGDLSAMYDEIDPALACDKAEEAISYLPEWTGRRSASWLNMSYRGGLVSWGKANRDNRVNVDFARLMQMCRFDCANTLYKFCGKVNRRKFGVPMGGFMSPALAILCCGMIEFEMEHLGGLVGFVVRYMDDVFGTYAVGTDAEAEQVSKYFGKVAVSYPPPLVLNVEPVSDSHRFLELVINTAGGSFSCHLWNPVVRALRGGERVLLRMPSVGGGTTKRDRLSLLVGAVYRMVQGCFTPRDLMLSVVEMSVEFVISTCSNSLSLVRMALHRVSKATEKDTNVRVKLLSETLMGLYWMLSGL